MIKNKQDSMLQQAIIISQNGNSIEASKWARIASLNAETYAWISYCNYI